MALLVIGSSNTDMVISAEHLPAPGETILGKSFFMNPGGKGANQAVAAARLGGDVIFICKTGNDIFGTQAVETFRNEGINSNYLLSDPVNPSGVALITVDDNGENCIVVASGSNGTLSKEDLIPLQDLITNADLLLMQLEIPLSSVEYAAQIACLKNTTVILNPAPACPLPDSLLKNVSIITPNETEAHILTGIRVHDIDSAKEAAKVLNKKGIGTVVITLGGEGALVYHENQFSHVSCVKVKAVDTTAAGDIFNGALAVALCEGADVIAATSFACKVATISVTRMGAQASAPYKNELS
jgi:ribokinase